MFQVFTIFPCKYNIDMKIAKSGNLKKEELYIEQTAKDGTK